MILRHLIDFCDIKPQDWNAMYNLACDIKKSPQRYSSACKGKILATLFYEPSTRTQLSFQTAMMKLGGTLIGFADPNSSSVKKGESLRDTIKIISLYADIAVIRNPVEGAAYAASLYSDIPIINAGDGGHLHPTQTMADMFTIMKEKGRYNDLDIGFCGDLMNGRTVHSLLRALIRYKGNRIRLISTKELGLPDYIKNMLDEAKVEYKTAGSIDECIGELDILYMTRIQRERFSSEEEFRSQSGVFILTGENMKHAKDDITVLHPLPKVDEIEYAVDDDPRAKYFAQAENGLYIRMALILMLCEANPGKFRETKSYPINRTPFCPNPHCISNHEKYLPVRLKANGDKNICEYCDNEI